MIVQFPLDIGEEVYCLCSDGEIYKMVVSSIHKYRKDLDFQYTLTYHKGFCDGFETCVNLKEFNIRFWKDKPTIHL